MQLLENWDPLKLPRGSIRALITLALLGTFWTLILLGTEAAVAGAGPEAGPGREIPPVLGYLLVLIVGYYFGARSGDLPAGKKGPLYLPRGTVRLIIIAGSAVAAYFSWRAGRLELSPADPAFGVLLFIGALLLGFLIRKLADLLSRGRATTPRRWFENLKSIVVLMATAVVVVLSLWQQEDQGSQNLLLIAGGIVGFYFGSRR
jgi:hypothetical protein